MKFLKDTFQQSFKFHNYWVKKKHTCIYININTYIHTYPHALINAHRHIYTHKHIHTHID